MTNYYEILGVAFNVGEHELKERYKKLALQNHPDKHGGDPYYEEKFKSISEAYRVLSDPVARKRYDLKLFYGRSSSLEPAPASYVRKTPRPGRPAPRPVTANSITAKGYAYLGLLIGVLITGGVLLYYGMNSYAGKTYYNEAELLFYSENYQKAFLKYMQVLEVDPENTGAYERLGDLRIELMGDHAGAIQLYRQAIRYSDSANTGLYLKTGKAMHKYQGAEEAGKFLKEILLHNPGLDSVWVFFGEMCYASGDYPASLQAFEKAVLINPAYTEALYGKALVQYILADYQNSLKTCDQLIVRATDNPAFYMLRARIYLEVSDTLMACTDLHKANLYGFPYVEQFIAEVCKNGTAAF